MSLAQFNEAPPSLGPRESSGSLGEEEDDIFMMIDTSRSDGTGNFRAIEQPKPFGRMESFQKERQISVDPISLKGATVRQASFTLVSPQHPSAKPPPKLKFVSTSLPSSTSSSPRSGSGSGSLLKKIWNNESEGSPRLESYDSGSIRRRSKSMSEERETSSPIDEFDLTLETIDHSHSSHRDLDVPEDGFKCGKLCLFLPLGKGKPVRPSSRSSVSPLPPPKDYKAYKAPPQPISRTVSMERFDCRSFRGESESSREPTNLFFDLPLELIRYSVSDMQSPVASAFVFDKDEKPKGVLKKTTSSLGRDSKSRDSTTRHVRFSTSSPTVYPSSPKCITPRLRKATQDFTAFLEAQTTT